MPKPKAKGLEIIALNNKYTMAVARGNDALAKKYKEQIDAYHAARNEKLNMKKK